MRKMWFSVCVCVWVLAFRSYLFWVWHPIFPHCLLPPSLTPSPLPPCAAPSSALHHTCIYTPPPHHDPAHIYDPHPLESTVHGHDMRPMLTAITQPLHHTIHTGQGARFFTITPCASSSFALTSQSPCITSLRTKYKPTTRTHTHTPFSCYSTHSTHRQQTNPSTPCPRSSALKRNLRLLPLVAVVVVEGERRPPPLVHLVQRRQGQPPPPPPPVPLPLLTPRCHRCLPSPLKRRRRGKK